MSRRAPLALLVVASAALVACGAGDGESSSTAPSTVPNVGNLPGELAVYATTTTAEPSPTTDAPTETTEPTDVDDVDDDDDDEPAIDTIGQLADGPRVLVLGDSITQSIGEEYSGGVCRQLVPEGWQVAMDAEASRFIDDGLDVLEERLAEGEWDAAVLNFGSNYRDDPDDYGQTLRTMLNRLLPRPVLLVTVSEPQENRAEVNYVLREAARRYENVRVLEWSEETRADDSLTGGDGLHLSTAGQELLASLLGTAMGEAPGNDAGSCLDIDDLAGDDTGDAGGDTGDTGDAGDGDPADTTEPSSSPTSEPSATTDTTSDTSVG